MLLIIICLILCFLTSVLVVAALMLSPQISHEKRPFPEQPDVADTEQLMRFPHGR